MLELNGEGEDGNYCVGGGGLYLRSLMLTAANQKISEKKS